MLVKLIHLDGSLPNLALMKLAHWHRGQGHTVTLTRRIQPRLGEPAPDLVYASAIFEKSAKSIAETRAAYPPGHHRRHRHRLAGHSGAGPSPLRAP